MKKVAHQILMAAIEAKTKCSVIVKANGVTMYSYQDRIGIYQTLALYMSNYGDINGVMGLRLLSAPHRAEPQEQGSIFIDWNKVENLSIHQVGDRFLLRIDQTEFNFLEKIENLEL